MWFLQILQIYSIGEKTISTIECNKVLLLQLISLPVSKFMPQMILSIPTSWFPHNLIPATDLLSLPPGEASVLQTESTDLFIKSGRLQLSVLKRFASRNRVILNIFRCSFQSGVLLTGIVFICLPWERRRHEDSEWEDAECEQNIIMASWWKHYPPRRMSYTFWNWSIKLWVNAKTGGNKPIADSE